MQILPYQMANLSHAGDDTEAELCSHVILRMSGEGLKRIDPSVQPLETDGDSPVQKADVRSFSSEMGLLRNAEEECAAACCTRSGT